MNNPTSNWETELNKLLIDYLGVKGSEKLSINMPQENNLNGVNEKINTFYKEQLKINIDHSTDRIKVDRIITYSEKNLEFNQFFKLLIELGKICISNGKLDLANEIFRKANKCKSDNFQNAEALFGLAEVYNRRANWAKCIITLGEAAGQYKLTGEKAGVAKCENLLGTIFGELGDLENAKQYFLSSLSFVDSETDPEMAGKLEANLGIINNIIGNSEDALKHLQNAINIYSSYGNNYGITEAKLNSGIIHHELANYSSAIEIFDEGIKYAKEGSYLPILCLTYHAKAQSLIAKNCVYDALEFANKALEISHSIDDKLTLADIYKVKGIIERRLKNFNIAEELFLNSLRINTSLKNEMNIAEASFELALLYDEINDQESKNTYLRKALVYFTEIKSLNKVEEIENMINCSLTK